MSMTPNMPRVDLGRPATYDDLLAAPDHLVAELVDDELWTSPRPAPRHANACAGLNGLLVPAFQFGRGGPGGWHILPEPELHFGRQALVADLAGWRKARMPRLPDTAYFTVAPDWVCEILSPSTALLDRSKKLRLYAEAGVAHAWLVDPTLQTLEVLRLNTDSHWALIDIFVGNTVVRIEPFDALGFELGLLWEQVDEG